VSKKESLISEEKCREVYDKVFKPSPHEIEQIRKISDHEERLQLIHNLTEEKEEKCRTEVPELYETLQKCRKQWASKSHEENLNDLNWLKDD